jgi:hypothetical protein
LDKRGHGFALTQGPNLINLILEKGFIDFFGNTKQTPRIWDGDGYEEVGGILRS